MEKEFFITLMGRYLRTCVDDWNEVFIGFSKIKAGTI